MLWYNRALTIMAVAWAKEYGLVSGDMVWYKERWEQGKVLWDFEFYLRKTTTARRPDSTLEVKSKKKKRIYDMACPLQRNM